MWGVSGREACNPGLLGAWSRFRVAEAMPSVHLARLRWAIIQRRILPPACLPNGATHPVPLRLATALHSQGCRLFSVSHRGAFTLVQLLLVMTPVFVVLLPLAINFLGLNCSLVTHIHQLSGSSSLHHSKFPILQFQPVGSKFSYWTSKFP